MHLFEVIALDVDGVSNIPMFAASYDMAAHYYAIWWTRHREGDMPDFEIRRRNPGWPGLDVTLLRKALDRGYVGVGRFSPETGWTILFPDHEDLGAM